MLCKVLCCFVPKFGFPGRGKAAFVMYYLVGEEDFINQYSIFSYAPAQFPENFVSPRGDGSDFVIPFAKI